MSKNKKKAVIKPVEVPPELQDKVNTVKNRMLFLSPSILSGEERECRKDDFESLANSNIGVGGFGEVYFALSDSGKEVASVTTKVQSNAMSKERDNGDESRYYVPINFITLDRKTNAIHVSS